MTYKRNQENAIADLTTAAAEFKLVITHVERVADEFGRPSLRLGLDADYPGVTVGAINRAALPAIETFAAMGWHATLHVSATRRPVVYCAIEE